MNSAPFNLKEAIWWQRERDRQADEACGDIARQVALRMDSRERLREPAKSRPLPGQIHYAAGRDRYSALPEYDDTTPIAPPFPAARVVESRRFADAEANFEAVSQEETGRAVKPDEFKRQQRERAEIRRQSHLLAHMLESGGTVAYRHDAFQLWIWHVHSLTAEQMPNFRRICFLPYIAAMVRASKLAALEFFLDRNPFSRFWTFTSGERVGIPWLRPRIEDLHARLNRLNKELIRRFGVEIVFRSTELGSVEFDAALNRNGDAGSIEFDADGQPLFHVHAHCVIHSRVGYIKPDRWKAMVDWVWSHWEHHWDAGQMIRNARECCKYVTKPGDMLKLSVPQLVAVEAALHGLRLVAPLGTLRREIAARKARKLCLRRKRTKDGMIWVEVEDHNKHLEQDLADQEAIFEMHRAKVIEREDARAGWEGTGKLPIARDPDAPICRVLARLAPAAGPAGRKEPRVIVGGNYFDRQRVMNHPLVVRLWASTVQQWEALRAEAIRVHTGTSTGERIEPMGFLHDIPERMRPPSEPVFAT